MKSNPKFDKYFEENKPFEGLGRASLHSGLIFVAGRSVSIALQVISMVLLGRLLSPHDFGLVAMVLALIGFGPMLIDLGTTEASTQRKHITVGEVSSLFWLNVAIGVLLTVLLAGGASVIAGFYGEPALTDIARVSSLTFIMTAVTVQHSALMRRAMQFRNLAVIDIYSNVIGSIVSIVMAFTGWGYWALVAKPVVTAGLTVLGVWLSCPWLPGWPVFTKGVRDSVRFGMGVTGFTMTDYFARSADRIALGYFFGAGTLGYYQNAFLLYSNVLSLLSDPLHNIAVSSLSKLRGNLTEFKHSWTSALSMVSFVSALAFGILAVTGQDIVAILFGQKWAPAGPLLCIFAVRGIAQTIERTLGWLHVSAGRSDRWMWWGFFSAVCQLAALAAGLPFGLTGVAISYTIAMFLLFIPALVYAGQPVEIGLGDVLAAVGPQTLGSLVAVAIGIVAQPALAELPAITRVLVSSMICIAAYLAIVVGVFRVTGPIRLGLSVVRDVMSFRLRRST